MSRNFGLCFVLAVTGSIFACACSSQHGAIGSAGGAALGDASSLTQRSDGQFDVVCKSGVHEIASPAQIEANSVCNVVIPSGPLNIQSMQLRADGSYDIICVSGAREVDTSDQIRTGAACAAATPPPTNPGILQSGTYTNSLSANSDIMYLTVNGSTVTDADGNGSTYTITCNGATCTQTQPLSASSIWTITSATTFTSTNQPGSVWTRTGDATHPPVR
jgi:hypothetical protein